MVVHVVAVVRVMVQVWQGWLSPFFVLVFVVVVLVSVTSSMLVVVAVVVSTYVEG